MTRAYRIVLAVALSGVASQHAWSWGNDGHKIVGAIALQFLSSDDRAEVQRLTRLYKTPDGWHYRDFPTALIFPDLARSKAKGPNPARKWRFFAKFNRWHFLNVPRDTDEVNLRHCGFDCVLRGIDWHLERLQKGNLEDWKRAEALFFLGALGRRRTPAPAYQLRGRSGWKQDRPNQRKLLQLATPAFHLGHWHHQESQARQIHKFLRPKSTIPNYPSAAIRVAPRRTPAMGAGIL